ncbi:MAG: hypothetical protein AAGA90_14805 [Actinomycetota bacterium]
MRAHLVAPTPRRAVEQAWHAVVDARPDVHVSPTGDGRWRRASDAPTVAVGAVEPELDRARHAATDHAVGVLVDDDPATTITLVVDHSLTDGLGARVILEDLLRALAGTEVALRRRVTDEALDELRTRRPALAAALAQIPPRRVARLGEIGETTQLASRAVDLAPLDARRRVAGVSVGSVIIQAVLDGLAANRAPTRESATVAVGVPADLRRHIGEPTGVGNAVVNLTITTDDAVDLAAIGSHVDHQTTRRRLGETLTWVRRATRPGPPRTAPRRGRLVATAMLSNLGRLGDDPCWRLADRVTFAPPAHDTVSIGVVGLGAELTVTVRSRLRDVEATAGLADDLARRLGSGRG